MKKYIVLVSILLATASSYAQQNKKKVIHVDKGDLIETTYFYADGSIEQQGTFNKNGKLHGLWTSYDVKGEKTASGKYDNGHKVGTWTFWTEGTIKKVEFDKSKIVKVVEKDKQSI
ncbi:hypothetical protein MHTCC0001_16160 [Flavobacteriaceae bacterium MHTCC 0001]